jgi:hypothetical protein
MRWGQEWVHLPSEAQVRKSTGVETEAVGLEELLGEGEVVLGQREPQLEIRVISRVGSTLQGWLLPSVSF